MPPSLMLNKKEYMSCGNPYDTQSESDLDEREEEATWADPGERFHSEAELIFNECLRNQESS